MKPYKKTLIPAILGVIFLFSCEKSTEPEDLSEDNGLLRAIITNNWPEDAGGEGIMFISDQNGNLIDYKTWRGDSELKFEPPPSMEEIPDYISLTTVIEYSNGDVELESYLKVPVSSKWIFEGGEWTGDYITIEIQNVPSASGYLIVSTLGDGEQYDLDEIYSGEQINLYYTQGDIYVLLNLESQVVKYNLLTDIQPKETNVLDLSTINLPTEKIAFNLPHIARGYSASLRGYPENLEEGYELDDHSSSQYVSSTELNYPPGIFSKYRTNIRFYDEDTRNNYCQYVKFGEIATFCMEPNMDLSLLNVSPLNFMISTTGVFDRVRSRWEYETVEELEFEWIVNGPPEMIQYKLPVLPEIFKASYEGIDRASFNLNRVYLHDYSSRESYSDILSAASNPNSPYDDWEELYVRVKRNRD